MPAGTGEMAVVDYVYDGDTIKLQDGRHIRILGVNAPEVDHGKERTGQALGEASREATEAFLRPNKTVQLFYDEQRVDHYDRTLAHVYDTQGNSLAANLLRLGLGFHVAIPPNLSLNECLHGQESIARHKNLGVWSHVAWQAKPAVSLTLSDTGFQRISGRIINVRESQSIWLELDGPLVIKIAITDLNRFPSPNWQSWQGKKVEVRGWVMARSNNEEAEKKNRLFAKRFYKPLIVQPRTAGNLEVLAD
jgi:micrococcal nuclease